MQKLKEVVFLNGKFITPEEAKISVLAPGFLYGWGLFETMRAYYGNIVYLDAHLKRMKQACVSLKIKFPYSLVKLKEVVKKIVKINGLNDAYLRITLSKSVSGTDTLVTAQKYQPYPRQKYKQGFRAYISNYRQNEHSFLARLKTSNYLFYQLAYAQAKNQGFDEAIILNNRGYISEGSRSNIFLIKDKALFTPALECGCLDGITRRVIMDLAKKSRIPVYSGNFTVRDLSWADEAFLTNSLLGVMPLVAVEKRLIGEGRAGKISCFFMRRYNLLLRNEA